MSVRLQHLADLLQCPRCGATSWSVRGTELDGTLTCGACTASYGCARGVLDLGEADQDTQVAAERAAVHDTERQADLGGINDTFEDLADAGGDLRDALLALPYGNASRHYAEPGYFANVQASTPAFDFLLGHLDLTPGRRLLDLGADLTWSTSQFARRGLDCVAVDINHHLAVGQLLGAHFGAPYHLVRTDMRHAPFRPMTFDVVFAMSALHHNPGLSDIAALIGRVLRSGGQLAFSEPYCTTVEEKQAFGVAQIAAGISEQTYLLSEWHTAFTHVGLEVQWLRVCESFCAVYRKRADPLKSAVPDDLQGLFRGTYAGCIAVEKDARVRVPAGSAWTIPAVVENRSHAVWCSRSQYPVYASYHLYRRNADGIELTAYDTVRTHLPRAVDPGERIRVDVDVLPIDVPGDYIAEIDLVQEYVTWFAPQGFGGASIAFSVT